MNERVRLPAFCPICAGWYWCGRPCGMSPERKNGAVLPFQEEEGESALAKMPGLDNVGKVRRPNPPRGLSKYRDPEKRREYMKNLMRKRREEGKA